MAKSKVSPVTGILEEDQVVIDFGEHTGKSVLEIADCHPDYYEKMAEESHKGGLVIRRSKDKSFKLEQLS